MRGTAGLLILLGAPLAAQQPAPAAETITAADMHRRIAVIADDSMLGRDTPSRGLDMTAQYVADEFKRLGLKPGGEKGTYFQRYPISKMRLDLAQSAVTFRARGTEAKATLDRSARYVLGAVPEEPITGPVLLVSGKLTPQDIEAMPIRDKLVLFVGNAGGDPKNLTQVARAIRLAEPKAIVNLVDEAPTAYAGQIPKLAPERMVIGIGASQPTTVEVNARAVSGALKAAGLDLAALAVAPSPVARPVPGLTMRVALVDRVISTTTAPNTIGILEGSDPKLKHEYVLFSAHMDHDGVKPGAADSIYNGADDDASGTSAVLEIAEAFSRAGARPKRSLVFVTVSGEEKGLWGSRYFSERPTVPLANVVAGLNIDMIGRNWTDTIVVIGKEHSDLGETMNRVNAAHPELDMNAIDDRWPEERFYFRSDHYNFARKGVPILFFFNGVHEDYHQTSDELDKINTDKAARIARLIYYTGEAIANAPGRPEWKPESKKEIVETS